MTSYGYPITVSVATGRGRGKHSRRKLHAFAPAFPEVSGPGKWRPETPITPKQLDDAHRQGFGTRSKPLDMRALHAQRESSLGIDFDKPLSNESVHLADGVDVSGDVLAVIFDALESAERFEADLGDLKVIVSQLGWRIAQFISLDAATRRHAEQALYTEILRRCTTLI